MPPAAMLWHTTPVGKNKAIVHAWIAKGTEEGAPLSKAALHGFERSEVHARFARSAAAAQAAMDDLVVGSRSFGRVFGDKVLAEAVSAGIVPDKPLIVLFKPSLVVEGDDQQQFKDEGLDPKSTSPEEFYNATGEWPSSTLRATLDFVPVPSEWRHVIEDVRRMTRDGWYVDVVKDRRDVNKTRLAKREESLRDIFEQGYCTRVKKSRDWPTVIAEFVAAHADALWTAAAE